MANKKSVDDTSDVTSALANPALDLTGDIDTTGWVDERFGYAPYWNPIPMQKVAVTVMMRDEQDPEFVRYLCRNEGATIECFTGPKEAMEPVLVKRGDEFAISAYHSVARKFDEYLESGINPIAVIWAIEKVKVASNPKNSVWKWGGQISPSDREKMHNALSGRKVTQLPKTERPALRSTS